MIPSKPLRACASLLVLCAASAAPRADVWIVSLGGFGPLPAGVDFREISSAVAAAAEGDTILVRNGTYRSFAIEGKSLSVVATAPNAFVDGYLAHFAGAPSVRVRDLAPGQSVVVRGLRTNYGVEVTGCAGAVWFDEVRCLRSDSPCAAGIAAGASVTGSGRVTFTRCVLEGQVANPAINFFSAAGSPGLHASASGVRLQDCTLAGGWGPSRYQGALGPQPGAPGMRLDASTVTVIGCTILGGPGGREEGDPCSVQHAPGGPGVEFVDAHSRVRSAASTAAGGVLRLAPLCPGQTGPEGPAIAGTGTIVALPGFARHLRAASPVRTGETIAFEVGGQPGELPLVLVSLAHEPMDLLNGCLLIGLPPADVFVLPALPASGLASLDLPVPSVAGGLESLHLYAQAAFLDATSTVWLGGGTTVVLLD